MSLKSILSEKKDIILSSWFDRILDTYPPDTAKFLKNQKDRFANPVGQTIYEGIEGIFEELLHGGEIGKLSVFLDTVIRVRAVQDFSASQAVAFIFFLKDIVREEIKDAAVKAKLADELASLDSQIDSLALIAFDIFMKCREKLYDLKANEARSMTFRLLQQAKLVTEIGETDKETNFISIQKKEVTT